MLVRGGIWGIILAVAAAVITSSMCCRITPSARRLGDTRLGSLAARSWDPLIATMHDGSGMFGAIADIAGAVIGTYAGHAARLAAIDRIGSYPAAIVKDLVAIGLAAFIITR
jgi:uncharacterized membrane protein